MIFSVYGAVRWDGGEMAKIASDRVLIYYSPFESDVGVQTDK